MLLIVCHKIFISFLDKENEMNRTQFSYTKEFEVFDLKHKNRFEKVARAMFGEGVISFEMVQRGSTFWLVRIKFESSEDCGRFLRFLKQTKEREDKEMGKKERERKKCIENQIRIHEYGKQEIKTTVADVEDAYNNATCDETRDTLKRVFKDAFPDEWEDITNEITWTIQCIGMKMDKTLPDGIPNMDVAEYRLLGYHEKYKDGIVLIVDANGLRNEIPSLYYVVVHGEAFAILRKKNFGR